MSGPTPASARRVVARIMQYSVLLLVLAVALGPVLWTMASSFKTSSAILTDVFGFPIPPSLHGYRDAFEQVDLHVHLLNTLFYAAVGGAGCTLVALLLAYPCARLRFPFRKPLIVLVSSGLAVPTICLIAPEFFIMLRFGLLDTRHGMTIFYIALLLPLAFVILRAYLLAVPREVEEAASIDGASYFRIVFTVVAPLIGPALATVFILVFISIWNDFLWNLVLAPGFENRNAQVVLALFRGQFEFNVAGLLAGTTIVLAVPVVIFILTQKFALAGLTGVTNRPGSERRS